MLGRHEQGISIKLFGAPPRVSVISIRPWTPKGWRLSLEEASESIDRTEKSQMKGDILMGTDLTLVGVKGQRNAGHLAVTQD